MSKPIFEQPPHVEDIKTLFNNCFSIPVFQRPYSWTSDEINELFNDVIGYFNNKPDEEMFIGTVYLSLNKQIKTSISQYDIIDGQQRITTLSLTLLMLYHNAKLLGVGNDRSVISIEEYLWKITDGRTPNREEPLICSGGIEKKVVKYIFDQVFINSGKSNLINIIEDYTFENKLEERVISNLKCINKNINEKILCYEEKERNVDNLLRYIDFIINNLKFIAITVDKNDIKRLFEIFESINSKGKQLDQIDLIKSYIFQNIDGNDYNLYLEKWGYLIKETEDQLEDYMYIFVKAFIRYYKVNISAKYFRTMDNDLMKFYAKNNISDAFKAFLDDMVAKVTYYKKLVDKKEFIINNIKFKFYATCMNLLEYEHPKALLFRTYCDFGENEIDKTDITEVMKNSFIYMFTFQTLSNRDSKDAIKVFEKIMTNVYSNGFDSKKIVEEFSNSLKLEGIDKNNIKNNLINYIGYSERKEKIASRVILAAYEFSKENKIDYDKGLYILNNRESIQIDHILPQTPDKDDVRCYYYPDELNGITILKLKKNHDFNIPGVVDSMDYILFKNQVLNKIGNLRLMWRLDNGEKSNDIVELKEYSEFSTYAQISERGNNLAEILTNNELFDLTN